MAPLDTRRISFAANEDDMAICGVQGDAYFERVSKTGLVHPFYALALESALPWGGLVFDVGANIGATALAAARLPNCSVVAFEPDPSAFGCLLATIKANRATNIDAHQLAFGAQDGRVAFSADRRSSAGSHVATRATLARTAEVMVPVTTIDRFVARHPNEAIDLIKIDAPGSELDIIAGAMRTIKSMRPSVLVEFNAFTLTSFRNVNPRQALETLHRIFPYLYCLRDREPEHIRTEQDMLRFFYELFTRNHGVEDLLGTFRKL